MKILKEQIRFEIRRARTWMGIAIGLALSIDIMRNLALYSASRQEPVNVLEGFLYCVLDPQNSMLFVLGYLFLISDAPFINERTLQVVVRARRRTWNTGCLFYIMAQAVLYYLVLLVWTMAQLAECGYMGKAWSIPTVQAAQNVNVIASNFEVSFPFLSFMQEHTVIGAVLLAMLGNILYAVILGIILYIGNLGNVASIGTWVAVVIHFTGYITRREWKWQWSLQSYASPADNGTFVPLYVILGILVVLSYMKVKNIDYHVIDKDV